METLKMILSHFDKDITINKVEVISNGLLNTTYKVISDDFSVILQKINTTVFPCVEQLMNNIKLVTDHIHAKTGKGMYVIPTKDGKLFYKHKNDYYRVYTFVENSIAYNRVESPAVFHQAGLGFGKLQNDLADFDSSQLYDVIKGFHDTVQRFDNFMEAVESDVVGRVKTALDEIEFLKQNENIAHIICDRLIDGRLPYRVSHNDTKLNNILFDSETNEPICAIDFDTVMMGSVLFDFGDAIRYGANPAGELGRDAEKPHLDIELFCAFLDGFLEQTNQVLTDEELDLLPESVMVITYEQAVRFLDDYLRGDIYFGEAFKDINLLRARVQIDLLKDIMKKMPQLKNITDECKRKYNR